MHVCMYVCAYVCMYACMCVWRERGVNVHREARYVYMCINKLVSNRNQDMVKGESFGIV